MKLFFRKYGKGSPVVILHGLFGVSDNWVTFAKRIGEWFEVFIPDLRNHGHSLHSNVFDFPSLAEDLGEFIEEHGLENIRLIGHSLGGKIAAWFALENPGKIDRLVVVDVSLGKYPVNIEHQNLIDAMLNVDFSVTQNRSDVERQLEPVVKSAKLRQFLLKNVYWNAKNKLGWRLNLNSLNENLPRVFEDVPQLSEFNNPVLFIRGGLSNYLPETDIPMIRERFPSVIVKTIENAGHWVQADQPEEFYSVVSSFLHENKKTL